MYHQTKQSAQRKAHSELNQLSTKAIDDIHYVQYGFGMVHFCKNAISSARNFRLMDMSDTFTVSMLTAIWTSKSEESKNSFKDRHSDELCTKLFQKAWRMFSMTQIMCL